jgi:hypothetical protein
MRLSHAKADKLSFVLPRPLAQFPGNRHSEAFRGVATESGVTERVCQGLGQRLALFPISSNQPETGG